MIKFKTISSAATAIACATLVACGGGGDSTPALQGNVQANPGPSAEGVYGGKINGSSSTDFQLLVLENGDFYSLYGFNSPSAFAVAGFIQGSGTSDNGKFLSTTSKDYGTSPATAVTTAATYDATAKTISGTVTGPKQVSTFSGGPISGSLYNYNAAASLGTITGSWSTTTIEGENVALTVASNGTFSAIGSSGCQFSGTVAPRASGKNVFNVSLTFGAAPCALPGQSGSGIAIAYPITGGKTQLVVAASNTTRSNGTAIFGTR